MSDVNKVPDDLMPLLREIGEAAHRVLNPDSGPTKIAYILIVAPVGLVPPVQCEILSNATPESVRVMLLEAAARTEGRVFHNAGQT